MADIVYPGATPVGGPLNSGALPSNNNLVIYKGDYVEIFVTIKDSLGAAINLTNYTPAAVLKSSYEDFSPRAFTCSVTNAPGGVVRIFMSSAQTKQLFPGSYIWDFQVTNSLGETRTYLAGDVTVYNEVTD